MLGSILLWFVFRCVIPSRRRKQLKEVIRMDNYDIMNESINNLKNTDNTDTYENAVAIYKEETPIQQGVILRPLPDYGEVHILYDTLVRKLRKYNPHLLFQFRSEKSVIP